MSLLSEKLHDLDKQSNCKAAEVLAGLDSEDRTAVEAALLTHSVAAIVRVLRDEGIEIGETTMVRHKAERCACYRKADG